MGSVEVQSGSLRSAVTNVARASPWKEPRAIASSAGSRSSPTVVAFGIRLSTRSEILPVPQARSSTLGSGPTTASTMSSITRNRSSRSGRYHSCCRSQLLCQPCQSASFSAWVVTGTSFT